VVLDLNSARFQDAAEHLREGLQTALRTGSRARVLDDLDCCGYLCAMTGRRAEAVTLWAAVVVLQGHTDAQIAGQLFISVRTVSSHLDRIRDKTGCRRRADLTRLALSAGLV